MRPLSDVSVCMPYWAPSEAEWREITDSVEAIYRAYPEIEVSLCDDGSRFCYIDATLVGCARDFRRINLPPKAAALNPCVPINRSVEHSTRPVIVLTNPGAEIPAGALERMLAELDDNTYVAAACRDVDTGRWLCHSTVKGGQHGRGPMPEGSGFHFLAMLTRELWDKAGGFDEDYREGQAYDDNDFLWRLHRVGANFKVLDDVVIEHKRSTTVWPAGGLERNRRLFERKWGMAA